LLLAFSFIFSYIFAWLCTLLASFSFSVSTLLILLSFRPDLSHSMVHAVQGGGTGSAGPVGHVRLFVLAVQQVEEVIEHMAARFVDPEPTHSTVTFHRIFFLLKLVSIL
jgi:hypothetical protein